MKFLMLVCVEEDRFENDEAARGGCVGRGCRGVGRGGYRG